MGCSLGLDFEDCASDQQCPVEGEVCREGRCEAVDAGSTTGSQCTEGEVLACFCPDGSTSTQVCTAGLLGSCDCPVETSTGSESSSGPSGEAECTQNSDCVAESECGEAICSSGVCEAVDFPAGTPCGDSAVSSCNAADTCDGAGACVSNLSADGSACADCPLGEGYCSCDEGACVGCDGFASVNGFAGSAALEGWTLSGDWALFYRAPETATKAPVEFSSLVVGTNGNRAEPYPGAEVETSSIRSPVSVLPEFLEFRSWHVDEAGNPSNGDVAADNRIVRVSTDGGERWTVLVDCSTTRPAPAFCVEELGPRSPSDWDEVFIPVPKDLVGSPAIVEILYDTLDDCCGEEQGWYIDDVNFGTRCGCEDSTECAGFDEACGEGTCASNGDCRVVATRVGSACGDEESSECNVADSCSELGVCVSNDPPNWQQTCSACPDELGGCGYCVAGGCLDCQAQAPTSTFAEDNSLSGWVLTGDWGRYDAAPPNASGDPAIAFSFGEALGTDGNLVAPYGAGSHQETSSAVSPFFVVPSMMTFDSWHLDEGGFVARGNPAYDSKTIEISVDGGGKWTTLVDCSETDAFPFCLPVTDRAGDAWDPIVLDTSAFEGQSGQLRFGYDTIDGNSGEDRGWYVDNLSLPWCLDTP